MLIQIPGKHLCAISERPDEGTHKLRLSDEFFVHRRAGHVRIFCKVPCKGRI